MQDKFYLAQTDNAKDLPIPKYMTKGAAGMDLYANVSFDTIIKPGEITLVPTGIKISMPQSYEAQIRPRSGLALNHGITMVNSPGTVDSDFRGELKLIIINHGKTDFVIRRGERIAQMIINKIENIEWIVIDTDNLDETERGSGGYGHTGKK